ncbi:pilus biosynthesis protein TadE [Cellulomonas cellasea DSM 20118]|uniref:Pilus biosynthesis protein TadE n=2 Tax=Cellulomonas cellasea TaxID=43670 RepID=A0A0A0BCZ4_9CELL|nr:TadE family protein [Cellulomonas cellasea]KGM03774.1 pilus biosynthesis protein TadE [Cellulomonas cellasea DSM 20118]
MTGPGIGMRRAAQHLAQRAVGCDAVGGRERGSAAVDFALVGGLITLLFAGVVQIALVQHVRSTLVDCAAEGARYAALADRAPQDGVARTRALIESSLSAGYAQDVSAARTRLDGLDVVEVTVTAPLPVAGLLGPGGALTVTGHALAEDAAP